MKKMYCVLKVIVCFVFFIKSIGFVEAQHGTLVDTRDGHVYKTTVVGTQTWMAQNLNYDAPPDSIYQKRWVDPAPNPYHLYISDTYCYNDSVVNCKKYGRLYIQEVALKACPLGWHLPSKVEFDTLLVYLKRTIGNDRRKRTEALLAGGSTGLDIILSGYGSSLLDWGYKKKVIDGQVRIFPVYKYAWKGKRVIFWQSGPNKYKTRSIDDSILEKLSVHKGRCVELAIRRGK